jgi:predicted ATPase
LLESVAQGKKVYELYPDLHSKELNLNAILFILSKYYVGLYNRICKIYIDVFPFIKEIKIQDLQDLKNEVKLPGQVPVFSIKEKGVSQWISLDQLSSGMQKVLLILTDLFTMPPGSIYLVDEYENSLGVNAINFFPDILVEDDFDIQFFIISHHPYIINKIPMNSWYVFYRKGSKVNIMYGKELEERLGKSKQQAFIKLLNDSFYLEGKE